MRYKESKLKGNFLIDIDPITDDRGLFARYFCKRDFKKNGLNSDWVQANNSFNEKAGTLRGLHFQKGPNAEIKLVKCISGEIWDVVVDLRTDSKTFGEWFGSTLSSSNRTMMYVPEGFAHGFISLKPFSEVIYLVSNFYEPESEQTLIWNDPKVDIEWPLMPRIISEKDKLGCSLQQLIL